MRTQYCTCRWNSESSLSEFYFNFHLFLFWEGEWTGSLGQYQESVLWVSKGNETKFLLKLSAPAEFMINRSIRNFTLLLSPSLMPSGLRDAKETMGMNLSRTLQGPPRRQIPPRLLFLMCRRKPSMSQPSPSSKEEAPAANNQHNTVVGPLAPPEGI